ncbi:MAG TPA: glycosyltransferase [Thermoanaerobaculia bacterium]|nr:glycosyltransferase [Thermoanaerobaculia bacterium]
MTAHDVPAAPEVSAVVPTVGRSPWLAACLQALRRQQGVGSLEIVVVDQSPEPLALPPGLADRVLRPGRNLGFAGGTNLGLAAARGELLATVNDDAVVAPGWLAALTAALRAVPAAAAVQGVNLIGGERAMEQGPTGDAAASTVPGLAADVDAPTKDAAIPTGGAAAPAEWPPGDPERIDGCGLGWNRWWQAIQLGHGEPAPHGANRESAAGWGWTTTVVEVFGVSATAALFRRTALEQVAVGGGEIFDPRLVSYYEDAELAGRLRAAGFSALLVPAARARHAGAASGRTAPASRDRWRLVYGNRYLAAARLLGRGLWPRLPLMVLRDILDVAGPAVLRVPRRARTAASPAWAATSASTALPRSSSSAACARHGTGATWPSITRTDATLPAAAADRSRVAGILAGWGRALRHLPAFARGGAPAPPLAEVARLSRWPAQPR